MIQSLTNPVKRNVRNCGKQANETFRQVAEILRACYSSFSRRCLAQKTFYDMIQGLKEVPQDFSSWLIIFYRNQVWTEKKFESLMAIVNVILGGLRDDSSLQQELRQALVSEYLKPRHLLYYISKYICKG